jgi:GT2 family glycosyltransferase
MSLATSIVIPTYRRPQDLTNCINSILIQSCLPVEVIVVDNDPAQSARPTVCQFETSCNKKQVCLYYRPNVQNGLPAARNLGVTLAVGEIVLFLDDDIILDENYISEILKVYETNPSALGVQGYFSTNIRFRLWSKIFLGYQVESNVSRLLPSIRPIYPINPKKLLPCELLSGCCASYRRSALLEFPFDENLVKYSFGEDLDQSYRIYRSNEKALWMTPSAKCVHVISKTYRAGNREQIYMEEIYGLYLFHKLLPRNLRNRFLYGWSVFGRLLDKTLHPSRKNYTELRYRLSALRFCWHHMDEIKTGNMDFFNQLILNAKNLP